MDRKQLLDEKRSKLAALKEARNSRKSALVANRPSLDDINKLVDELIGSRPLPPPVNHAQSPAIEFIPSKDHKPTMSLATSDFLIFDLKPDPKIESYEKQVQTVDQDPDSPKENQIPTFSTVREQMVPLKDPAPEVIIPKQYSQNEISDILHAENFLQFFNEKSKIIERAINDTDLYDFMIDYRSENAKGVDNKVSNEIKLKHTFTSKKCVNRSVTSLDWSPKHSELCLASYNKNPNAVNEPDAHMPDRPEFFFHAQSDVLTAKFSEHHNNYIVGGTYSGQILLWDTRASHNPVLKSPLSQSGHTHPVYSLQIVGSQNANQLVSASTDGAICSWQLDMLAHPSEVLELMHPSHPKTNEVSITCFEFPNDETASFFIGTEEGNVYSANRYDRAGHKAGLNTKQSFADGHKGMITSISHHPTQQHLLLTSSLDWTVRLWNSKIGKVLRVFDECEDYVMDSAWSPTNASVFTSISAGGDLVFYDLNEDIEVPCAVLGTGRAGNKLAWDRGGRCLGVGGSEVCVYDVGLFGIGSVDVEFMEELAG